MDKDILPGDQLIPLRISSIREEAADVKTFFLETDDAALTYKAGQFLTFLFNRSGRQDRRSYSISSSPAAGDPFAITVKRVENGAHSRWLTDHAQAGDMLNCTGAAGLFTLPDRLSDYLQIFFFAAGIGITPIYSMIKELLYGNAPVHIVLYYSNRSQSTAVFYEELIALAGQYKSQLDIVWLFSDAKNLLRARISKANMHHLLQEHLRISANQLLCYICGPEDYRWIISLLLEEAGVRSANIRKEIFLPGRMPVPSPPPDTAPHRVTIRMNSNEYILNVQYPETILSAAKKAGIRLPHSCEAGRCASCIVSCKAGQIWMTYNEVLTAGDLQKGLALTCTGYPVHGDVVLAVT